MYAVDLYGRVRRACHVDGMSKSEAARMFGIDRKTVAKILKHSVPPGYRRAKPPVRPKLDPFIPIIDQIPALNKALTMELARCEFVDRRENVIALGPSDPAS